MLEELRRLDPAMADRFDTMLAAVLDGPVGDQNRPGGGCGGQCDQPRHGTAAFNRLLLSEPRGVVAVLGFGDRRAGGEPQSTPAIVAESWRATLASHHWQSW